MGNPIRGAADLSALLHRQTYKETDDYRIWTEIMEEQLVIHVAIYNSTKAVIQEIKEGWAELMIDAYFEGYEFVYTYTSDSRIVKMIGGATKVGEHEGQEVWQWDLR